MKKILSMMLSFALILGCAGTAFAETDKGKNNDLDIYNAKMVENVIVGGIPYSYSYYYDGAENRCIDVKNTVSNTVDKVCFNPNDGNIFLNGQLFGNISSTTVSIRGQKFTNGNDAWVYFGSGQHTVSWAEGVAVGTLAAIIAVGVGNIGGAAVIAAMGYTALAGLAYASIGGTVTVTVYKFNSNLVTQWRYDWTFTANTGDYYGPYTSLSQIY